MKLIKLIIILAGSEDNTAQTNEHIPAKPFARKVRKQQIV